MQPHFFNKGKVSNLATFALLILGLLAPGEDPWQPWILATGLFGFAGGITNWLAVKMLFDRVPLLYGSGVIPNRFREIREQVKLLIMTHFFDTDYLERFFGDRIGDLSTDPQLEGKIVDLLASDEVDEIVERKLEELQASPSGAILKMVGTQTVKPLVVQFLGGIGSELAPRLVAEFAQPAMEVDALRDQVDQLLTAKLEELTPATVKEMMEEVMRQHLGWLIVWGNVFGGLIGLVSHILGY